VNALVEVAVAWAVQSDVPNWLFAVALLTSPSRWTNWVIGVVRDRVTNTAPRE
jgi:hypothetical protein